MEYYFILNYNFINAHNIIKPYYKLFINLCYIMISFWYESKFSSSVYKIYYLYEMKDTFKVNVDKEDTEKILRKIFKRAGLLHNIDNMIHTLVPKR